MADYATDVDSGAEKSASSENGRVENANILRRVACGARIARLETVTPDELKKRTKKLGVDIFNFARTLPTDPATGVVSRQLVRSGTAVGANYRGSCRAKSRADFVSKMTTAEEEADETQYWLELLVDAEVIPKKDVTDLLDETEQLVRIFVASIKTARGFSR